MEYNYKKELRKFNLIFLISSICSLGGFFVLNILFKSGKIDMADDFLGYIIAMEIFSLVWVLYNIKIMIKPESKRKIKKYGSPEELEEMFNEINNTVEYIDNNFVLTSNYIINKTRPEDIIKRNEVIKISKIESIGDKNALEILGKNNKKLIKYYLKRYEDEMNKTIEILKNKCNNIPKE